MRRPSRIPQTSFTETTWDKVRSDSEFAKDFFDAYLKESVPLQMMLLRTLAGVSQVELAGKLNVKQTHLSRLEKGGSDHLISVYEEVGKALHAKLALIPNGAKIVLNVNDNKGVKNVPRGF